MLIIKVYSRVSHGAFRHETAPHSATNHICGTLPAKRTISTISKKIVLIMVYLVNKVQNLFEPKTSNGL